MTTKLLRFHSPLVQVILSPLRLQLNNIVFQEAVRCGRHSLVIIGCRVSRYSPRDDGFNREKTVAVRREKDGGPPVGGGAHDDGRRRRRCPRCRPVLNPLFLNRTRLTTSSR